MHSAQEPGGQHTCSGSNRKSSSEGGCGGMEGLTGWPCPVNPVAGWYGRGCGRGANAWKSALRHVSTTHGIIGDHKLFAAEADEARSHACADAHLWRRL